ncbi:MAG: RnfABCDGE type electron transport complex subunit G [Lachnospiraceae bacterium]|nr:RnfABCDGE type electron transport complex subunit G [Lachnospiraceae bacterium]
MNKLVKDALTLTVITVVAGAALGLVHEITLDPIAKAQEATKQEAYKTVFESAETFTDLEGFDADAATKIVNEAGYVNDEITGCVVANDASGNACGYVITVLTHDGYGGDINFSVGITNDGVINGYSMLEISETPGLGMKSTEEKFMSQFNGIKAQTLTVTKTGKTSEAEIDAISGATITSKSVTNGVNASVEYFNSIAGGGANE